MADVWRDTRLIVLVAQTAAVYAAILIPFKVGIPLIPGFVELRPANAVPIVASLLFGPAAAWGTGLGNLIGDCFGTLGPGSLFGFLGNFCYGYVPHLLWGRLGPFSSGREPEPRSWRQILELVLICLVASLACALVIGWGVDLLGLVPFQVLAPAIFLNNVLMGVLLVPPLLGFLYPRVKRWGLRYEDIRSSGTRHGARGEGREEDAPLAGDPLHGAPIALSDAMGHEQRVPPSPLAPIVTFRAVSFTYTGAARPALDRLSLEIRRGESVAVMGRSGAGKSTLCFTLNGLVPQLLAGQWEGQVLINGHDTASRAIRRQAGVVGILFQDFETQLVSTNVEMELAFSLEHLMKHERGLTSAEMRSRIRQTLGLLGLTGMERRDPLSLSGGERQRLAIASILVREPAVLALDEPMTDLDPVGRGQLVALLARLKAAGTTVVLVEHDPEVVVSADRICVLQDGKGVWDGPPRALFGYSRLGELGELTTRYGIRPPPLACCFSGLNLPELPLTVEEAWTLADADGLTIDPDPRVTAQPFAPPESPRPAERTAPALELQEVSYEYPHGGTAVSGITLTIREGEFVAIIGQNGSGKTTLATLLNGLRYPSRGCVLVRGQDTRIVGAGRLAAEVGYVFQNPDHQIFAETIEEEVAFGVRNQGLGTETCRERVKEALDAVGLGAPETLPDILQTDPFSLTKGDRQRVAVASVLAARPRILIFDEPTTGLDAVETDRMMLMLRRLNREGYTIIMITHALSLVAAYAHRCLVMHEGRIILDGDTRRVFADTEGLGALGFALPPLTRFAARWGHTLLTVGEVRAALRRR